MQKATFAITIPHFFLPISTLNAEVNHKSITSRFCVHGTFQINQFLIIELRIRRYISDLLFL
jgi:hypothetical protein